MSARRKWQELLKAANAMPQVFGRLNDCVYCGTIFVSQHGMEYKGARHRPKCRWAALRRAVRRVEAA